MRHGPVVGFVPNDSGSNPYARRMQDIIAGCARLERFTLRECLRRGLRGNWLRFDVVILNWVENRLVSRASRRVSLQGVVRVALQLLLMRIFARRLVFVRHNLYPHRTAARSALLAQKLIDYYERCCDVAFVHSGDELTLRNGPRARHYLPHPLYQRVDSVDPSALRARLGLPARYFLVFGRIVPYKRIEQLMARWPAAGPALVVCGEVGDQSYSQLLATRTRDNIVYQPGLLAEEEAQALVLGAEAVIIAHAEPNTLVSGTFFYALSLHRPVVALRTAFLEWIAPRLGQDMVALAADLDALCAHIGSWQGRTLGVEQQQRLQREFGDAAIRRALAIVLPEPTLT